MKNLILILTVIIIIFAGGLLRFYDLGGMPPGLNIDGYKRIVFTGDRAG